MEATCDTPRLAIASFFESPFTTVTWVFISVFVSLATLIAWIGATLVALIVIVAISIPLAAFLVLMIVILFAAVMVVISPILMALSFLVPLMVVSVSWAGDVAARYTGRYFPAVAQATSPASSSIRTYPPLHVYPPYLSYPSPSLRNPDIPDHTPGFLIKGNRKLLLTVFGVVLEIVGGPSNVYYNSAVAIELNADLREMVSVASFGSIVVTFRGMGRVLTFGDEHGDASSLSGDGTLVEIEHVRCNQGDLSPKNYQMLAHPHNVLMSLACLGQEFDSLLSCGEDTHGVVESRGSITRGSRR
ncbi:hypothetical protein F4810DRAFT_710851 [Camillea tinctor]|nr:hypothetical protein F4810DRAFT_710851 [Camillea tinctor]